VKKIIGIIGEKGSGKGTCVDLITKISKSKGLTTECVKTSALLAETLTLWNIPHTRNNLQYLAIIMNKQYGDTTLSDALRNRIEKSSADIVVYESIRWQSDLDMVRSFANNLVIYVTAPVSVRYDRTVHRGEKIDEAHTTFEKFVADEQVATETEIVDLSRYADIKIENIGTEEDLENKLRNFI